MAEEKTKKKRKTSIEGAIESEERSLTKLREQAAAACALLHAKGDAIEGLKALLEKENQA